MYISCINFKKINFFSDLTKNPYFPWKKTVHLKRGTKSLGKHSEFEALVQVKQTVHHSETTARSKCPKKRGNESLTLLGAARQPASLFFLAYSLTKPSTEIRRFGNIEESHGQRMLPRSFNKNTSRGY